MTLAMVDATSLLIRSVQVVLIGGLLVAVALRWRRLDRPVDGDDDAHFGPELCGQCGYDVRGGLERCPECGGPTRAARRRRLEALRTRWPTEVITPRTPDPDEQPVVILVSDEGFAVELLRQHLEARGIAARRAEPQVISDVVYTKSVGSHRLVVWSADEERARAIVERLWGDVESTAKG